MVAALRLFRERGFAGTGVDDIGRAAGMAGSGIYRSYPSKTDILLDAYDRAAAEVTVGAETALAAADSALDALAGLAVSYAIVALGHVDLIFVTSREGEALPAADRPRLARRRHALRDAWSSVLRQARPGLPGPGARLLARGVLPLANQVALLSRRLEVGPDELAALMLAFVLSSSSPLQSVSQEDP
jgi:AcrR family transcriptional regulator